MFEQRCKTSTALTPGKMPPFRFHLLIFILNVSFAKLRSISSWQYEIQLKRWNIRKNATRSEWQQYFAANKDQPITSSRGDGAGTNLAPVILSKSTASKKRASRWASGSIVAPNSVLASRPVLAPRVSGSTSLGNEEHPNGVLSLNERAMAQRNVQTGSQDGFQNKVDSTHATESSTLLNEPCSIDNFTIHSVIGTPSRPFAEALYTPAHSLDFSLTYSAAPGLQSPLCGDGDFDLADFSLMDLPARNNMGTFTLQDIRQILPFAQLEKSIVSRGIMLERSAGNTVFGGFASRVVAGILSSKDQSMVWQTPNLQQMLRQLGSQTPGESSALITDDQAFETKFARLLLLSMLNGFAGLEDIPIDNILRFLNRFVVNNMLLEILEQSPRYVSRTLADTIFHAAIEATDTNIVDLLLERNLVDVNGIVCRHNMRKDTPIGLAATYGSLKLIKSLIDAGADVNKFHDSMFHDTRYSVLGKLIFQIAHHQIGKPGSIPPELLEAFQMIVAAGARAHPRMLLILGLRSVELDFLICAYVPPESHQEFFKREPNHMPLDWPLEAVVRRVDDRNAATLIRNMISLCRQAGCNKCLGDLGGSLGDVVIVAAEDGKVELVQLLLDEADLSSEMPRIFLAAIDSKNRAVIDLILSHGPDFDPPATVLKKGEKCLPADDASYKTPIAEAVRHGNEDLIRILEAGGALDHLTEGNRFRAIITAATEAGNTTYVKKLLARAVTSKQPFRVKGEALALAIVGDHRDILQLLLEAGAKLHTIPSGNDSRWKSGPARLARKDLHAIIASGVNGQYPPSALITLARQDHLMMANIIHEYPDMAFHYEDLEKILINSIENDTPESFKEILEKLDLEYSSLRDCLETTIRLGHVDLADYLLDMGANPFDPDMLRAVMPDRPEMLRLLFKRERRRQTTPKCIGVRILAPFMSNGLGNSEALDELIGTNAIDFAGLDTPYDRTKPSGFLGSFSWRRFTPLGLAIQGIPGKFETNMVAMKKFLQAGADPNGIAQSNDRWTKGPRLMTALMVAVEIGRDDAVNMLLDYGADVDARPRVHTTRTALQFAAELGDMDMVRLLLSHGADVNSSASSHGGATALQFAVMTGNCNTVAELLDHGAQLDALPSKIDGMWPLEGAAANGRLDMIRFLWELKVRAERGWEFPKGFSGRQCLRAMNFARENGHIGCRDLISELSGISVDRLETDEYGAPWIAY